MLHRLPYSAMQAITVGHNINIYSEMLKSNEENWKPNCHRVNK